MRLTDWLSMVPFLVLDGAMATEMERRGYDISDPLWSGVALYRWPEIIRDIHLSYLRAGVDIITTASYQATKEGFRRKGFSDAKAEELIQRSVTLAKEACRQYREETKQDRPIAVAASVGPYGAFLADGSEYRGHYGVSRDTLASFHEEKIDTLLAASPDFLAFETFPSLVEAEVVGDLLAKRTGVEAWISFSCQDGHRTCGGDAIRDCVAAMESCPSVVAIGVNCTSPVYVESLVQDIRKETEKPIVVYPNDGEIFDIEKRVWTGSAVDFAVYGKRWYEAGARILGGCCRTGPKQMEALVRMR